MADLSVFCVIDDKHVPLWRILWISSVPHFCGAQECQREGQYEVRLEGGESLWADRQQRDCALSALADWHNGISNDEPE